MNLRRNTLIIIGTTVALLIVILYAVSQLILIGSFVDLENQKMHQNVERGLNALSNEISDLDDFTYDWASWDDTYNFIQDRDPEYIDSNLVDETFIHANLNLIMYVDSSGRIVTEKAFDLENKRGTAVPKSFYSHLSPNSTLLYHQNANSSVKGIILLSEGPMFIVSRPILTSNENGPIRGSLIMGRYLNQAEIQRLSEVTRLPIIVDQLNSSRDKDLNPSSLSDPQISVRSLDENSIEGSSILKDIYGNSILLLKIDMPREIYRQGQKSTLYFLISFLVVGVLLGLVMLIYLDKAVLSRLHQLSAKVSSIGVNGKLSTPVSMKGDDELSNLANSINKMLSTLRKYQDQLEKMVDERTKELSDTTALLEWEIIEHKKDEKEIKKLNEDLKRRASELEAINKELESFSYSVSHDLRAPLRSIDGFSQALLEDYEDKLDLQGKDYLNRVRMASQRMAQLIDDLLNLSRLTRSQMHRKKVNLSEMANKIAEELQYTHPERKTDFVSAEGVTVDGDAKLLRVMLENLLNNAWKFTGKSSKPRIEFGITKYRGKPAYFVRDNGAGFDMEYADKLFKAFQRLHAPDEYTGSGIGLATVQRIIQRHGGRVWAEGKVNKGATFYFTLE